MTCWLDIGLAIWILLGGMGVGMLGLPLVLTGLHWMYRRES